MPSRKYIGWRVLWTAGPDDPIAHPFYKAKSEAEAREMVRRMNQRHPHRLYFAEWWSTSSMLNEGDLKHAARGGAR